MSCSQLPNNFCTVPFTTLIVNPDGTVNVCRQKGTEFVVGDLNHQTIDEIWNSEFLQKWRQEFLDGSPIICREQIRDMHCNCSPENIAYTDKIDFKPITEGPILKFGANFNGKCNVKCQMCNIWQMPNGLYDTLGFWEKAEQNLFPHLCEIDLYSGEPFIQKDTYRLIDIMSSINPKCQWTISTNLNWKLTDYIKEKLDQIEVKNIIVSIDSLQKSTFESIRKGASFDQVMSTLDDLISYDKDRLAKGLSSLGIIVNNVIQKDNAFEVSDLIKFSQQKGIRSFRSLVYEPFEYSLLSLSQNEISNLLDHYFSYSNNDILKSMTVIRPLLQKMDVKERKKYLKLIIGLSGEADER